MPAPNQCQRCGGSTKRPHPSAKFCFPCVKDKQAEARKAKKGQKRPASTHKNGICRWCSAETHRASNSCEICQLKRKRGRQEAYILTRKAIELGFLADPKALICQDCNEIAECYDHRDYNRPLDVEPVCLACNIKRGPGVARLTA